MHLHNIEPWILEESPRFAAAFADYYESNGRNIALFATTHMYTWHRAETYTGTQPDILGMRGWHRARIGNAVAKEDSAYFYKCARALDYMIDRAAGKTSNSDYLTPERFTIDAYHWLRVVAGRGSVRPTRDELRKEAMWLWAYTKVYPGDSKGRIGYQAFKDKVRSDWRLRESVEIQLANAEPLFPKNHFERILRRIGLDDLEAKKGRPRKTRKGASVRRPALVREKKSAKKSP
jgi:hypothetical protein